MSERIPEGWDSKKLDKLVTKHNSGVYKKSDLYGYGNNIIGVSQLYQCQFIKGQQFKKVPLNDTEIAKFTLHYGDLLYGESSLVRSGIAKTVCVTPDGQGTAFAWHTRRFTVDQKVVYPEFLNYFMESSKIRNYLEKVCTQTALTGITTVDYFSTPILLPPLPEQKKIVSIFISVDEVIENTQKQINSLQDLKKATMNELLTKGTGHTEFKDSELGRIPKSWEVKKLGDYVKLQGGNAFPSSNFQESGIPIVRISNIMNEGVNLEKCVCFSKSKIFQKFEIKEGDILLAMSGATTGKIGIYNAKNVAYLNQRVGRFQILDKSRVKNAFLHHLFQSDIFTYVTQRDAIGGAQPNISSEQVESVRYAFPTICEQSKIAETLGSIDQKIKIQKGKLVQTQSLKKSLMQVLLTGKVRVKVI
jgi:type I restriction enzyme, S subunit